MSIKRRGYIAAGLAVAVVGSMGTVWTLSAGAEELPPPPAPAAAPADPDAPLTVAGAKAPPVELPWGEKPKRLKKGRAGASSKALAAAGADIAASEPGDVKPESEWAPKGFSSKNSSLKTSETTLAPPAPPAGALAEPVAAAAERKVNYYYSSAYQYTPNDGSYANLVISKPKVAEGDYHSLAEIAVQSADGRQIVEVGWTVDRGVNGDDDPHLFVYHWVDRGETCYNGCGFVPYSKLAWPGMTVPEGVSKRFGIQHYNGAWWVAYDTEWLGYFPDSLWKGQFTQANLVQWFGEVAAGSDSSCSQMGNGRGGDDPYAARIGTISLMDGEYAKDASITMRPPSSGFNSVRASDRTFRYGGTATDKC